MEGVEEYQQEEWVSLYHAAVAEFDQAKMSERIEAAHKAIVVRMEKLCILPGLHPQERQAIEDAVFGLRSLKRLAAVAKHRSIGNSPLTQDN
jgi:hypothetical protein